MVLGHSRTEPCRAHPALEATPRDAGDGDRLVSAPRCLIEQTSRPQRRRCGPLFSTVPDRRPLLLTGQGAISPFPTMNCQSPIRPSSWPQPDDEHCRIAADCECRGRVLLGVALVLAVDLVVALVWWALA